MSKFIIELQSAEQARVVEQALDVYVRLGLGQLNIVDELVRFEQIPFRDKPEQFDEFMRRVEAIDEHLRKAKELLGFGSGASHGIGSPKITQDTRRGYEIMKTISQALAYDRDPNPEFKGVNYDGVTVRYTQEPLPTVLVTK